MDKYCINEYGIRYNCETSYDSFDTVNIDKNKIRVGHDLFSYATGSCLNVLKGGLQWKRRVLQRLENVFVRKKKRCYRRTLKNLRQRKAGKEKKPRAIFAPISNAIGIELFTAIPSSV